jgi:hypothetical protein
MFDEYSVSVWSRDMWLSRAVHQLRPMIERRGLELPEGVLVHAGTTSASVKGAGAVLGECWQRAAVEEGVPSIVINGDVDESGTVLSTLVHELIHSADVTNCGHGSWFAAWASALGLVGAPSCTRAGAQLRRELERVARILGPYPNARYGYTVSRLGRVYA